MPGLHSQRPLSRKRIDGQSLTDKLVWEERRGEMMRAARDTSKRFVSTFFLATMTVPVGCFFLSSVCMASGTGSGDWLVAMFAWGTVLSVLLWLTTRGAKRTVDGAEELAIQNIDAMQEVVNRMNTGEEEHVNTIVTVEP